MSSALVGAAEPLGARTGAAPQRRRHIRMRAALMEPLPDEPTAVVVAGGGSGALLRGLLGDSLPAVPVGSYLVVQPGREYGTWAYVPGARQPCEVDAEDLLRPPRRAELSLPDPLLRRFALVQAPDAATLGVAGARVLLDAVERGGALLYAASAERPPSRAELDLLASVAGTKAALFVAVPAAPEPSDAPADAMFVVGPAMADTADLRRALVEWAGFEGLRRASDNPPVPPGLAGTVRVAPDAHESDWADRLERACRTAAQTVRQRLAIELANIHLRGVQEIVFRAGCAGLPDALDREMHALSLRAVVECDAAVERILDDTLTQVLGEIPADGVRRRVTVAVRRGFADDPATDDLDRVLLITGTGGVASVVGADAVTSLAAYHTDLGRAVLPPFGLGLSGPCYRHWRNPANGEPDAARAWLQRAVRGVELDLLQEVSRRFDAVHRSLRGLLADAIDHGILLA